MNIGKFLILAENNCLVTAFQILSFLGHPWICENGVAPDQALDPAVLSRLKQFSAMNKLKKMALRVSLSFLLRDILRSTHVPLNKLINLSMFCLHKIYINHLLISKSSTCFFHTRWRNSLLQNKTVFSLSFILFSRNYSSPWKHY